MNLVETLIANRERLIKYAFKRTRNWQEAEDVYHDTYLRIRNLDIIPDSPLAYLTSAVHSSILIRRRGRRNSSGHVPVDMFENKLADLADSAELGIIKREQLSEVNFAIEQLPTRQRQTIIAVLQGESPTDLARRSGLNLSTVYSNYYLAVQRIRQDLSA
jgi:RNA polymerase sigma factor (sigma-70 family)